MQVAEADNEIGCREVRAPVAAVLRNSPVVPQLAKLRNVPLAIASCRMTTRIDRLQSLHCRRPQHTAHRLLKVAN